jgi:hypothetical protein
MNLHGAGLYMRERMRDLGIFDIVLMASTSANKRTDLVSRVIGMSPPHGDGMRSSVVAHITADELKRDDRLGLMNERVRLAIAIYKEHENDD